jgi:hypothetical protein
MSLAFLLLSVDEITLCYNSIFIYALYHFGGVTIYIYIYIYIYVDIIYIYFRVLLTVQRYLCADYFSISYTCIKMYMHICIYIHININLYIYIYEYIYIYILYVFNLGCYWQVRIILVLIIFH